MPPDSIILFVSTVLFSTSTFVVVLVTIALLTGYKRGLLHGLLVLLGAGCLQVSVWSLKHLFAVPRPADALVELTTYAFPSGHAAGVMFVAWVADWFARSVLGIKNSYHSRAWLLLLVAAVGYSRLYLGVHTWQQVLAGFAVGAVVGGTFQYVLYRLDRRQK